MSMNIHEIYQEKAKEFAKSYGENPSDHIIQVMTSAMMTRDKIQQGGSFVEAVVNNDLANAISRADNEVQKNLRIIVLAFKFAHLSPTKLEQCKNQLHALWNEN